MRTIVGALLVVVTSCAFALACSTTFKAKACSTDADCGSNVCEIQGGQPACVLPSTAAIHIGMSAPVTGPSQALGVDMQLGVKLAFDNQNAAGGIRGRQLKLDFLDDEYQPALAEQNARQLVEVQTSTDPPRCPTTLKPLVLGQQPVATTALYRGPNGVLAFLGDVGTPTMVRVAPIAVETGTLFFGAFTGATLMLRDNSAGPCSKYIFNVRASYAQEAYATTAYFKNVKVPDYRHVLSFDQSDSFGQAGYSGLVAAVTVLMGTATPPPSDPTNPVPRFRYARDDSASVATQATAVEAYLAQLLGDGNTHNVGMMLTATYGPASDFIAAIRRWQFAMDAQQTTLQKATRLNLFFSNVSFVGPDALASRLKMGGSLQGPIGPVPLTQNVVVSQVVPNYQSDNSDIVSSYKKSIADAQKTLSFTSLEGYIDARIFISGLLTHVGPFSPDALVHDFENLPQLNLGVGAGSGFSPTNHNYSKTVWGTTIAPDGTFQNLYFWTEGSAIQFFE